MSRNVRVGFACAASALILSAAAAYALVGSAGGRTSILVHMSASEPMSAFARAVDPGFAFVPIGSHYDGVYFYAIAIDPLARGAAHGVLDHGAYRYGHAGYGLLAWAASGGRAANAPAALLAINLVAVAGGAALASALAVRFSRSPWWGLAVALNPGIVYAVTADTSEPVGVAVALAGLVLWFSGRRVAGALVLAFAVVCKEPLLIVPASLVAWEVLQTMRRRAEDGAPFRIALLAVPAVVFVAWQAYLYSRFGVWPLADNGGLLAAPFAGFVDGGRISYGLTFGSFEASQLGAAALPLMIAFGGAMLVGVVRSLRLRTPFAIMFLLFAVLSFTFEWQVFYYPKDLLRWAAIALTALPAAFLSEERAPVVVPDPVVAG